MVGREDLAHPTQFFSAALRDVSGLLNEAESTFRIHRAERDG
jgi:hypothetical protein